MADEREKREDDDKSENTDKILKSASGRRTRSRSKLVSQQTNEAEEERKQIKKTDSSQDLSKEEIVKTYNLWKKDKPLISGYENSVFENQSNDVNQPGGSENTDDNGKSAKPSMEQNEIDLIIDGVAVDNNNVEQLELSGNIDSRPGQCL